MRAKMQELKRTMDIHLLANTEDDGSPFGVQYSTRRLSLEASGEVSCDDSKDMLWLEMTQGIRGAATKLDQLLKPSDGASFLDGVPGYLRWHFLGPVTPLVYDWRGCNRPDNFRIVWKPSTRLVWADGYQFFSERSGSEGANAESDWIPVAQIDGWGFFHDFGGFEQAVDHERPAKPRMVTVDLLPQKSPAWRETSLGPNNGPKETREFLRSFLRRFFERQSAGIRLDFASGVSQQGRFAWRGGF